MHCTTIDGTEGYRLDDAASARRPASLAGSFANALASERVAGLATSYTPLLFRVAHSILRSRAEAEDVVQETFLRVLRRGEELETIREPRVWLVRIAWNLALDRRRAIRPEQMDGGFARSLAASAAPADQALEEQHRIQQALSEIERLPAKERAVLLLSAMEELSTAEIAAVLGRSGSSVRSLLFRARSRLKQRIAAKNPVRTSQGAL
jgi:RNA polymerase sigma-70 factor (ECF subfamily)